MSSQKQPTTGPVPNKDYQPLLDRLLKLMREQMGERLLEESLAQRQEKE
jgi:transcriptional regulator GlxA family with amidase domain